MAMPHRDSIIEQIHRLEGLMAVAEQQKDCEELGRLKQQLLMPPPEVSPV